MLNHSKTNKIIIDNLIIKIFEVLIRATHWYSQQKFNFIAMNLLFLSDKHWLDSDNQQKSLFILLEVRLLTSKINKHKHKKST